MYTTRSSPYTGVAVLGGFPDRAPPPWTETPLDRDPLGRDPPDRHPRQEPPDRNSPQTETPLDKDPLDRDPLEGQYDQRQRLPWRNIRTGSQTRSDIIQIPPPLPK